MDQGTVDIEKSVSQENLDNFMEKPPQQSAANPRFQKKIQQSIAKLENNYRENQQQRNIVQTYYRTLKLPQPDSIY